MEANSNIKRLEELERLQVVTGRKSPGICEHTAFKQVDSVRTSEV